MYHLRSTKKRAHLNNVRHVAAGPPQRQGPAISSNPCLGWKAIQINYELFSLVYCVEFSKPGRLLCFSFFTRTLVLLKSTFTVHLGAFFLSIPAHCYHACHSEFFTVRWNHNSLEWTGQPRTWARKFAVLSMHAHTGRKRLSERYIQLQCVCAHTPKRKYKVTVTLSITLNLMDVEESDKHFCHIQQGLETTQIQDYYQSSYWVSGVNCKITTKIRFDYSVLLSFAKHSSQCVILMWLLSSTCMSLLQGRHQDDIIWPESRWHDTTGQVWQPQWPPEKFRGEIVSSQASCKNFTFFCPNLEPWT